MKWETIVNVIIAFHFWQQQKIYYMLSVTVSLECIVCNVYTLYVNVKKLQCTAHKYLLVLIIGNTSYKNLMSQLIFLFILYKY